MKKVTKFYATFHDFNYVIVLRVVLDSGEQCVNV